MRARERAGYDYMGEEDNNRLSSQPLTDEEVLEQVRRIIHDVEEKPVIPGDLFASIRPPHVSLDTTLLQFDFLCFIPFPLVFMSVRILTLATLHHCLGSPLIQVFSAFRS